MPLLRRWICVEILVREKRDVLIRFAMRLVSKVVAWRRFSARHILVEIWVQGASVAG